MSLLRLIYVKYSLIFIYYIDDKSQSFIDF